MVSVSVIIGSESDKELGEAAMEMLKSFGVDGELKVLSAHRNPKQLAEYVEKSEAKVFIAIAGLAAALPGVVAAHTVKPVIGVPKEVKLGGIDALLSIVQMPTGIPVATVGIDSAKNASLLAVEILALSEISLNNKLIDYRRKRASSG
ncbi:MAG: 5-(carboxyamino)imidazole ribonucleotide mutase [Candidatus Bathyarchaeota archaeon]|nr:5-(carboxyamino)imidazole ribonucleotide mutase [Candidatus Bathyarchaeota archaeon]